MKKILSNIYAPIVALVLFGAVVTTPAFALPVTWDFYFAGPQSITGSITFNDTFLNPANGFYPSYSQQIIDLHPVLPADIVVTALSVNVSGAPAAGGGSFTLADYETLLWNTDGAALNFSQQLLGQLTAGSGDPYDPLQTDWTGAWGPGGTGDFNLVAYNWSWAPTASDNFTLITYGGNEAVLATPEPSTFLLLGAGLFGLVLTRRRNRLKD